MKAALPTVIALWCANVAAAFVHPGLLHTNKDFHRIKNMVQAKKAPWLDGWNKMLANYHSELTYKPNPQANVYRYGATNPPNPSNYGILYNDIAAAYALAIRWKVSGDTAYANASVYILNSWSSTLTAVEGDSDRFLASGIYGYQFANAAELMRDYKGWSKEDVSKFQNMMLNVFYPMNHDFLVYHNNASITHYWANWDLCNMASILAIGVLADRKDIYNEAIDYFKHGNGNGAIHNALWKTYKSSRARPRLAQGQEAGRDQGHSGLDFTMLGAIAQMAYNQGEDLFAYGNNLILAGAEYFAKYNLGYAVPYSSYQNSDVTQPEISNASRGDIRPSWELLYSHYGVLKRLPAKYTHKYRNLVRAAGNGSEGGGGNYGPNSGGFDQLGYGTLLYCLE
jgi:hypothetical protein